MCVFVTCFVGCLEQRRLLSVVSYPVDPAGITVLSGALNLPPGALAGPLPLTIGAGGTVVLDAQESGAVMNGGLVESSTDAVPGGITATASTGRVYRPERREPRRERRHRKRLAAR